MENSGSTSFLIRLIINFIATFILVFLSTKIKRNTINVFFVDIRAIVVSFAVSMFFLTLTVSTFVDNQFKFSMLLIIFVLLFFTIGFFQLFEYSQIEGKTLIVKGKHFKIEKVDIDEIINIKFLGITANGNGNPCIDIITSSNDHVMINSNMENLNGFINRMKDINPKIIILNRIPENIVQNIVNSILAFSFLFVGFYKLISLFKF
jgi:hypothetical protein